MTVEFQIQYMRQKALERNNNTLKGINDITHTSNEFITKQTTRTNPIPDMTDAYAKVRNSNHIPTEGEIHLRRFTSGSYVDMNPLEKK